MDVHCSLVSYGLNKQISQQFWRSLLLFLSESRHIIHIWSSETTVFNHFSVICSMILIMQFYFRFRFIVLFLFIWFLWDCHSSVFFYFYDFLTLTFHATLYGIWISAICRPSAMSLIYFLSNLKFYCKETVGFLDILPTEPLHQQQTIPFNSSQKRENDLHKHSSLFHNFC